MTLPYRQIARAWCDIATADGAGVYVDDSIYQAVTEHERDHGPRYSSCADLAHWLLFRLGVRAKWINRAEHLGWRPVVNVARLTRTPIGSNPVARAPAQGERFRCGDVIVMWGRKDASDAHVAVVDSHSPDGGTLTTWDYGQAPMSEAAWRVRRDWIEGCRRTRTISPSHVFADGRRVQSVLPLDAALAAGELAPPDLPPNWSDDGSE